MSAIAVALGATTGGNALAAGGGGVGTPDPSVIDDFGFKLSSAEATPKTSFFDAARRPRLRYVFEAGAPTDVRVDVINRTTLETVASFVDPAAEPNIPNVAVWDGHAAGGAVAPNGEYEFRIGSPAGGAAATTAEAGFGYYKFRFPIAAEHSYGDGFGAGRDHEGQDVFAPCGTKLLAARGGRVQVNGTHRAAGNYVVIDAKGTGADHVYAHMLNRSSLAAGTRVRTGQVVGLVGQSGNATGCHLHFELWSTPGYYEGGAPMASVGEMLKTWDGWS